VRLFALMLTLYAVALRPMADAQQTGPGDPARAAANLRQIAKDLDAAVKLFENHLDHDIAVHDRGYRTMAGRRIPAADADLEGQADVVQMAIRKLHAARLIAARKPDFEPVPLSDADRIQTLLVEARNRIDVGSALLRNLLVVSARELNSGTFGEQKARRDELRKARELAADAARRALVALPVPLPEADSPEEQRDRAWNLMVANHPVEGHAGGPGRKPADAPVLPIRFEIGKKIILINERSCRVTMTDSGMEDQQGRHLFYQEEWVTRPGSLARTMGTGPADIVVMRRWAVAVNTRSGAHTLLRRYDAREFLGGFDAVYRTHEQLPEGDYPASAAAEKAKLREPSAQSTNSIKELAAAVDSVERARQELEDASLRFRRRIQDAVSANDAALAAQNRASLEDELSAELRGTLFAIRGHLARAPVVVEPENEVRRFVEQAAAKVRDLEALGAFINGNALEAKGSPPDSRALLDVQTQADTAIRGIQSLERSALAALPPDLTASEEQFPALRKDLIVRIRRIAGPAETGPVKFRQEVWNIERAAAGTREVKRTIVFIDCESKAGSQIPVAREVKYYPMETGEILEQIYDENAAQ
jgi:hypothetical protein